MMAETFGAPLSKQGGVLPRVFIDDHHDYAVNFSPTAVADQQQLACKLPGHAPPEYAAAPGFFGMDRTSASSSATAAQPPTLVSMDTSADVSMHGSSPSEIGSSTSPVDDNGQDPSWIATLQRSSLSDNNGLKRSQLPKCRSQSPPTAVRSSSLRPAPCPSPACTPSSPALVPRPHALRVADCSPGAGTPVTVKISSKNIGADEPKFEPLDSVPSSQKESQVKSEPRSIHPVVAAAPPSLMPVFSFEWLDCSIRSLLRDIEPDAPEPEAADSCVRLTGTPITEPGTSSTSESISAGGSTDGGDESSRSAGTPRQLKLVHIVAKPWPSLGRGRWPYRTRRRGAPVNHYQISHRTGRGGRGCRARNRDRACVLALPAVARTDALLDGNPAAEVGSLGVEASFFSSSEPGGLDGLPDAALAAVPHRRVGGPGRRPTQHIAADPTAMGISSDGRSRCLFCNHNETPQWRYIHDGRYCNACYMRLKRWVYQNMGQRKLPPRINLNLSPEENARRAEDARELISYATNVMRHSSA